MNDGYTTTLYIDSRNWLVTLRRDFRPLHVDIDPTPTTIESHFSDFRKVNGVLFAFAGTDTDLATAKSWKQQQSAPQSESTVDGDLQYALVNGRVIIASKRGFAVQSSEFAARSSRITIAYDNLPDEPEGNDKGHDVFPADAGQDSAARPRRAA